MNFEALKQELAKLSEKDRGKIMAFLVALDERDDAEYRAEITRRIDDKDPAHWMTLEELERRLSIDDNDRLI